MSLPLKGLASTYSLQSSKWLSSGRWTLVVGHHVLCALGVCLAHWAIMLSPASMVGSDVITFHYKLGDTEC